MDAVGGVRTRCVGGCVVTFRDDAQIVYFNRLSTGGNGGSIWLQLVFRVGLR